jgi:heme/copper-type cytochrome/quinol oxidase subunit 2
LLAEPVWACPNCKESLATGPNAFNLVRGFFWSIVFMMSMPFLILGGLGSYFYWEVRKARARTTTQIESPSLGEIT